MDRSFTKTIINRVYPLLLLASCCVFLNCQPKELTSAKVYIQNNEWNKALEQLEVASGTYPENAEIHFLLGKAYGIRSKFAGMNRSFERSLNLSGEFRKQIIAERENYWTKKYNTGLSALNRGDYDQAENHLKTAIVIDTLRFEAYQKLALVYVNTKQVSKALNLYKTLLTYNPDNPDFLNSAANLYYSQKQYKNAVLLLKRVLEINPNHRDALANLALSYDSLNEKEKAHNAYEAAIAANPRDKDLIFLFAVHHFKHENYNEAIQFFQQILSLNPEDFEATFNIGNAYLAIAETLRQDLAGQDPARTSAGKLNDLKQRIIRNYQQAIPYLERALKIEPEHPALWRNLGVAYINTNNKEKGIQAFLKSEEIQEQKYN